MRLFKEGTCVGKERFKYVDKVGANDIEGEVGADLNTQGEV